MDQRTHVQIARHLCGHPIELHPGHARVALVHDGFTFGLADYAAMLAVNEPTVVLASAQTTFLGPVVVGDRMEAEATVERTEGKKRWVKVFVRRAGVPIFEGEFLAVVPDTHILDR
jgi:acyl-coenzyme A thioesterase PaaI-like protein